MNSKKLCQDNEGFHFAGGTAMVEEPNLRIFYALLDPRAEMPHIGGPPRMSAWYMVSRSNERIRQGDTKCERTYPGRKAIFYASKAETNDQYLSYFLKAPFNMASS